MNRFASSPRRIKLGFVVSIEMNKEAGGKVLFLMPFVKQAEQGAEHGERKELDHLSTFQTSISSHCISMEKYALEVPWSTCSSASNRCRLTVCGLSYQPAFCPYLDILTVVGTLVLLRPVLVVMGRLFCPASSHLYSISPLVFQFHMDTQVLLGMMPCPLNLSTQEREAGRSL